MFRIGDFSRIARVSARLLRFYDQIGLFTPAHADPDTGYRSYTAAQLADLNRITVLKELGFSLEQIGAILQRGMGAAELRSMLLLRRQDAEAKLAQEAQRLRHIETRIEQIEADGRLSLDDVVLRSEPAHRLLCTRGVVASFDEARGRIAAFRGAAQALLPRRHGCQLIVLVHAAEFEADALDLQIGFAVEGLDLAPPPAHSGLLLNELPEVPRMAACVRAGPPEEAHQVTARIGHFLARSGDVLDGPGREAFLRLPPAERMHEAVVEMQFPLQAR